MSPISGYQHFIRKHIKALPEMIVYLIEHSYISIIRLCVPYSCTAINTVCGKEILITNTSTNIC